MSQYMISRRTFIKSFVGSGIVLYLQPIQSAKADLTSAHKYRLAQISPVERSLPNVAAAIYYADDPERAHKILWDKAGFITAQGGRLPAPRERVSLAVIGGGISGLFSTYLLRKHQPVLLEQAPRFGGNAKGQSWRDIDYSIGAAYFIEPEADSDIGKILHELGIDKLWKVKEGEDPVALNGSVFSAFWSGETMAGDEHGLAQVKTLDNYFRKVNDGQEIPYPDIPITDGSLEKYIVELDRVSFREHLECIIGGTLHPQIDAVIEHYCWSSFGGGSREVSAASGLNFYAAEFGNLAVLPGGNSAAAERVLEKLMETLPATNIRPGSLVIDVRLVKDGVHISYQDALGTLQTLHAKKVIMACPKFVAAKLLADIEPERAAAIAKLRYRSYLVANVCLSVGMEKPFYDLYLAGDGCAPAQDLRHAASAQGATDVIWANFAGSLQGPNAVLTLYRGFPYEGARPDLYLPDSYERYRSAFESQIYHSILPLLKLRREHVVDIRLARWGHPLPLAATNLIADGTLAAVRRPLGDRIFFVEQDNWALPAFETALTEALLTAPKIG